MRGRAPLLALLVVAVAAAAWLLWPVPQHRLPPAADCEQSEGSCGMPVAQEARETQEATEAGEARQPARPAPAPPDVPVVDPAEASRLREEADRLLAEGRVPECIEVFRRAVEADPSPRNHGDLGALLLRLTAIDGAIVHLRRAAELDPSNADRWIALANAYYRKVDLGEAWKAERRAREAEPGLVLGRDASGMRVRKDDSGAAAE